MEPSGFDGELITINFVRLVIFESTAFASSLQSGGSMEYETGIPPASLASVG